MDKVGGFAGFASLDIVGYVQVWGVGGWASEYALWQFVALFYSMVLGLHTRTMIWCGC